MHTFIINNLLSTLFTYNDDKHVNDTIMKEKNHFSINDAVPNTAAAHRWTNVLFGVMIMMLNSDS